MSLTWGPSGLLGLASLNRLLDPHPADIARNACSEQSGTPSFLHPRRCSCQRVSREWCRFLWQALTKAFPCVHPCD